MALSGTETGRQHASGNAERHHWPGMLAAGKHHRRTAPSRAAFWLVAGVLSLLFCASAAPTPLYGIYRAQLRFPATTLTAAFLAGTAVAGVGFGLAVLGANRALIALAAPAQRASLIAAIFIINYLGLSIPTLIAGVATAHFGLHRTALAYCVAMAVLVAAAAGGLMLRGHGQATGGATR